MASLTDSVRSLQGRDVLTSYEVPQQAFEMQAVTEEEIPLMPLIIKVHFISTVTGEGIPNLRKTLYKVLRVSLIHETLSFDPTIYPVCSLCLALSLTWLPAHLI